jgi:energy-coupling factor transport system ATP-binding protein
MRTGSMILELRRATPAADGDPIWSVASDERRDERDGFIEKAPESNGRLNGTLIVEGLCASYATNASFALGPVTARVEAGRIIGLAGPNGAGKTTCLRAIAGVIRPNAGVVTIDHAELGPSIPVAVRARHAQYVFQNPDHQLALATVREELIAAASYLGTTGGLLPTVAKLLDLERVLSESPLDQPRSVRRLVTIGSAFVSGAPLVLLDEPTAGLDPAQADRVAALLRFHTARGGSAVMVSHDDRFMRLADTIWRMEQGRLNTHA